MANVPELLESTIRLIEAKIRADITQALEDLRTLRPDEQVKTTPPLSYFIYSDPKAYRTPAVFILTENNPMDFNLVEGPNHVSATVPVDIFVLLESQSSERLTIRAWRYLSAIYGILDQATLTSVSGNVTLKVKITRATISPSFAKTEKRGSDFRKEVELELEVEHWENF